MYTYVYVGSMSKKSLSDALHQSASDASDVVKLLLEMGVRDSEDEAGHTCLHKACRAGNESSVRLLIASGSDARKTNKAGMSPFYFAADRGSLACLNAVAEAGLDLAAEVRAVDDIVDRHPLELGGLTDSEVLKWLKKAVNDKQVLACLLDAFIIQSGSTQHTYRKYAGSPRGIRL